MANYIDLTGQRFGKLVAIKHIGYNNKHLTLWLCQCDCGNTTKVTTSDLRSGHSKSCGCRKYGGGNRRLYHVWHSVIRRCEEPTDKSYYLYGALGVLVCEEWHDYNNFRKWAYENGYDENAPQGKCTLDRINVDGNYEPSNCRWATREEQQRNRRSCRYIEYQGQQYTMAELGEILGMSHTAIRYRLNQGWSAAEITNQKPRKWGKYHQDVSSLNKTKKSNIKCENCRFFKPTDKPKSNGNCLNSESPKAKDIVNYWNRCKCFDWKEI